MAISFVGGAAAGKNDGTDPVIDLSGLGLQENDVVCVGGFSINGSFVGNADISTSGYTELTSGYSSFAGATTVQLKVMGGTPDSSITCVGSGSASFGTAYAAMVFRGVDTTTPEDVASVDNDSSADPPSIDPTTDDCAILVFGMDATASTATAPSGYGDITQASGSGGFLGATAAAAWKLLSGSAAEDPGAFGGFGSGGAYSATIALRPAAGGAAPKPRTLSLLGVG